MLCYKDNFIHRMQYLWFPMRQIILILYLLTEKKEDEFLKEISNCM